jgi:cyclase
MTGAEEVLWMHLRKGMNGYKFRRQHPLGPFIVDFFCHKVKLIIEIDGSIHNNDDTRNNDITRQNDLEKMGYTIIRFSNVEVYKQIDIVLNKISEIVNNIIKTKAPLSGV